MNSNGNFIKKRYTMQDIADAVGVSKATVSYVLNNKPDSRVSEDTRNRILHIANIYNYAPNMTARFLAQSLDNPVGIVLGGYQDFLKHEYSSLIRSLVLEFEKAGKNTILFSIDALRSNDKLYPLDAMIGINITEEEVNIISKQLFVPFILIDSSTTDSLFYTLSLDFGKIATDVTKNFLSGETRPIYFFSFYENDLFRKHLTDMFIDTKVHFYKKSEDIIKMLSSHSDEKVTPVFFGENISLLGAEHLNIEDAVFIIDNSTFLISAPSVKVYRYSYETFAHKTLELIQILNSRNEELYPKKRRLFLL